MHFCDRCKIDAQTPANMNDLYKVRRYREEREGSIEIRLEEGDLEVYYVKEEGTNGEEELLEGTMMTYETSRWVQLRGREEVLVSLVLTFRRLYLYDMG